MLGKIYEQSVFLSVSLLIASGYIQCLRGFAAVSF